jgi:TonB family protein
MANLDQQGVGITGHSVPPKAFPKEFRRGLFSSFEKRFFLIFAILIVVFYVTVGILSIHIKESDVASEKEILQIQERYAQLIVNQPKPKEKEAAVDAGKVVKKEVVIKEETKTDKDQDVNVDRAKESFVEKAQRKEAGIEERRQVRDMVAKQVSSAGIFAAITATGGSGSGVSSTASDLLGAADDGIGDLSNLSISKGTFAAKKVDASEMTVRKGTRTTNVGIQKEDVGRASVVQVATNASISITSAPPEITGESSSHTDRSQSTIGRIVSRETQRLKRVYEDWLKKDPALNGRLTIKFTILPSGSVSSVSIESSTTNNSEFDETIIRYIKRWQFPAVPDAGPVEVIYPFIFEGQS